MKRFSFKLEAVLKMRAFAEDNCKMELGQLISQKTNLQNQIVVENQEIDLAFREQEKVLTGGTKAIHLGIFPMITQGKKARIELLEKEITKLDELIKDKTLELAERRAQTKLMEKLKEKEFAKYKAEYNKVTNQKIEEQVQNWLMNQKLDNKEVL